MDNNFEEEKENIERNEEEDEMEVEEEPEEQIDDNYLNEKLENIMQKLENLNVDREIGEKEKNKESRVIIEYIELENFKSYAGVKKIGPLHHSFNAVVGPNGSGKSNLMECLLFVFGKRAKRMRLNKLNELIHNSSKEPNLKFARVTIFFKEIKDIDDVNFEEIPNSEFVLSREVYKNGSSKYFLNNREINFDSLCHILDKKEIDLKHNRFLILQGEVEQISMMKPKALALGEIGLLEFLEDIIGTSRYVNLIDRLGKDIDELTEIKAQKANRVKITKNELDQLEDVKNASTEYYKKEKELHMLGHLDFLLKRHQINKQIIEFQEKIKDLDKKMEDIDKKIEDRVRENSNILEEHKRIKKEQEELKQKKAELHKQADALEEIDKVKRADIENYSKNISKVKIALEKLNKNYQTQSENIQNAKTDLPKKEKEISELSVTKNDYEQYIEKREKTLFEQTEKLQVRKREVQKQIQPYEDKINTNVFEIEQNNSTINLISQKFERTESDLKIITQRKSDYEGVIQENNEKVNRIRDNIRILEVSLKESREAHSKVFSELQIKQNKVQNLLAKLSEIRNTNQERNQKNVILDSLMNAQKDGKLSGIYGRLGDLGMVDSKYDVAVTTASSNLDSIVVEQVDHAQKCLDYLKKNNIGRATFLILEKISWVDGKLREHFRAPNNCERLFDLIKYKNQKMAHAFYFALRDTLVAPDLKTASSVAYGNVRHRVVTLNGELIEVSGTMSGGGKPKRGGMSNKELGEEFSQEYINRLSNEYDTMVKDFEITRVEKNNLEMRCNQISTQLQENLTLKVKTENELGSLDKQLTDIIKNFNHLSNDYAKYSNDILKVEEMKQTNETLTQKNVVLADQSSNLRKELNEIESDIIKIGGEEFNKKKEELRNIKKRIDTLEKEISTMKHLCENSTEILERIKDEIELKEKQISEYEDQINIIKKEMESIENKGIEIFSSINKCDKEIAELDKVNLDKSKEVENLKMAIRKMREEQEKVKSDKSDHQQETKKFEKSEKFIQEDINKNKKSYRKLIEDFGFIDEFEKEIKGLNNRQSLNNIMMVDEEQKENEEELEQDLDEEIAKRSKVRKGPNNYKKYMEPKFMEHIFKMDELDELTNSTKEIAYEYTMLQTKINDMKPNMNAIVIYKTKLADLKTREEDLNSTVEKLTKAKHIFECVKNRRYNEFMEGFNVISSKLKEMYQLITNGGDAELELLDSLDPFSEGILFSVRPCKKSWKQISNLSGGEKTLSSLSLIFALHHYKPSPLYVLDEIDAALDFKNVSIIANYIKDQTKNSQFIIISLRNHMFELANRLIGIYKTHDITKCLTFNPENSKLNDN